MTDEVLIRVKVISPTGEILERHEINHNESGDRIWLGQLCREQHAVGNAVLTGPVTHPAFA